ncbi:MAG: aldo/keto reductase [Verrucomicrobiales bacterium]|nr:aldo/keto reductase [Verrucomicrobiales bacterium]
MKTQQLGTSALKASRLAYGCWRLVQADGPDALNAEQLGVAREAVCAAYEAGFTLFDLADIYSRGAAEAALGRTLKDVPGMRDRILITTKCGIRHADHPEPGAPYRYDFSETHILRSCEGSLKRLGVGTIDLYLLHRPDLLCDPEEVARAFSKLQESGKVREFGVSNFRPSQVAMLQKHCPMPLVANQIELSLWRLDPLLDGTVDHCVQERITPQAWSPLAGGTLVSKAEVHIEKTDDARLNRIQEVLIELAHARGVTPMAMALAWLLRHPAGIMPIIGSVKPERIREAATAGAIEMTREEWYRLLEGAHGCRLP